MNQLFEQIVIMKSESTAGAHLTERALVSLKMFPATLPLVPRSEAAASASASMRKSLTTPSLYPIRAVIPEEEAETATTQVTLEAHLTESISVFRWRS